MCVEPCVSSCPPGHWRLVPECRGIGRRSAAGPCWRTPEALPPPSHTTPTPPPTKRQGNTQQESTDIIFSPWWNAAQLPALVVHEGTRRAGSSKNTAVLSNISNTDWNGRFPYCSGPDGNTFQCCLAKANYTPDNFCQFAEVWPNPQLVGTAYLFKYSSSVSRQYHITTTKRVRGLPISNHLYQTCLSNTFIKHVW